MHGPRFPHELPEAHGLIPSRPSRLVRFIERKTKHRFFAPPPAPRAKKTLVFVGHADRPFEDTLTRQKALAYLGRFRRHRFVVVYGKSYLPPPALESLPENVTHLFATNPSSADPRTPYLPLGRDFRSRHLFDQIGPSAEKSILLYGNFSTDTHAVRIDLARRVAQLPFAQCDHMGKFLNYSLSREAFFQKVAASKFVLCPRGMGIESYRMWDTLALGAIPIVIREAPFHDQLADLPILFLKRPEEVSELSAHVLETLYAEMRAKQWNFEKLKFDFWLDRIRQALA
jgi:hypothetical protein